MGRLLSGVRSLLRNLWREEGSLGQQTVRAGVWVIGSAAVTNLLGIVQTIVLVRLLLPADFGVMGIAAFVLAAVTTFTETGVGAALVQRLEISRRMVDTAWTIGLARSAALFLLVFFAAPWVAGFYGGNLLICPILRLVALRFICHGLSNIGLTLWRKEMRFRRAEVFQATTEALAVILTIIVAFFLRSAWALAIGQVSLAILKLVGSYVVHPYRPRLCWHWEDARLLMRFGRHMTLLNICRFLKTQLDVVVAGKLVGMTQLGFYKVAYALSNLPTNWIAATITGVTFPALSKLQKDPARLRQAFLQVLGINALAAIPAAFGLIVLSREIVAVVYGPKYIETVPVFRVLCIYGLLRSLDAVYSPLFMGLDKPRLASITLALNVGLMAALLYPLVHEYGIVGAAWSTLLPYVVTWPLSLWLARRVTGARWRDFAARLGMPLFASAGMGALLFLVKDALGTVRLAGLLALIGLGVVTYAGAVMLLAPESLPRRHMRDLVAEPEAVSEA